MLNSLCLAVSLILFSSISLLAQSNTLYLPKAIALENADSGLALSNASLETITVSLTARHYDGSLIRGQNVKNPVTLALPAGSQRAFRLQEIFGVGVTKGWVSIQAPSSISGLYIIFDSGLTLIDGGDLHATPAPRIVFPKVTTDPQAQNELTFINATDQRLDQVAVSLFEDSGILVSRRFVSLNGYGGWSGAVATLFPDVSAFTGYAVVETTSGPSIDPLVGVETYRHKADIAMQNAVSASTAIRKGYLPHLAAFGGYDSRLMMMNPSTESLSITITAEALTRNDAPLDPSSVTVQRTLLPYARLQESVAQMFSLSGSDLITGFIRFEVEGSSGVIGSLEFTSVDDVMLTAVPAYANPYSDFTFSHLANGFDYYTGLALLNPNETAASVSIDAFNVNGTRVAGTVLSLAPNERISRILTELLPETTGQMGGHIHVTSSNPIFGYQLFGIAARQVLANVPAKGFALAAQVSGRLVIATLGANVLSDDGEASLTIPPNSLEGDTAIKITRRNIADFAAPSPAEELISVIEGTPAGTQFRVPGRLLFPLETPVDPGRVIPVYILNPATSKFEPSEFKAIVDESGRLASAEITHFTVFGLTNRRGGSSVRVSALTPSSAAIGATIEIAGTGFSSTPSGNAVFFAGQNNTSIQAVVTEATATLLKVTVPAGAVKGKVFVRVGPQTSNGLLFTVLNATLTPTLTSLSPDALVIGGLTTTINLVGRDFDSRATVQIDGVTVGSTYLDSTRMQTTVGGWTLSAGAHNVVVANPGAISNALTLNLGNPVPTISAVSPNTGLVGENISVTISGSGFAVSSVVRLDGLVMNSTYKNSISLTATVYSFEQGTGLITVSNPAPGGGASNGVAFQFTAAAATNLPPLVNAGPDQIVTLGGGLKLTGTAGDDNLPAGSTLGYTWQTVSGPATVSFSSTTSPITTVTFATAGTYTLRFTATDGALSASDDTIVSVTAPIPVTSDSTTFYVDPDFAGTPNGSASTPWRSLDSTAWSILNQRLATGNVTVYFSARTAAADAHQQTTTQIQIRRTDGSSNRLTLDGMSMYNANDSAPVWSGYSGGSRFTVSYTGWDAITGVAGAPTLSNYVTVRGFRAFSTNGKPINYWGGNNVVIEFNEASHSAFDDGSAGIQVQYARKGSNSESPCVRDYNHNCGVSNITIRNNIVHNIQGEGIYIGGVEDQYYSAHSNIVIENNTIYDVGMSSIGEGDAIDVKDGSSNIVIRGNTIYMSTPGKGRDGIVMMSGGTVEGNFIYNFGRAGIALSTTWNSYPTRSGTIVRNNIISNVGGNAEFSWSHGIVVVGTNEGDQWTNLEISSNTISKVNPAYSGDGRGISLSRYATNSKVFNNVVVGTAAEAFYGEGGVGLGAHDYNLYVRATSGYVAMYGSSTYTASTIAQFEPHSMSVDPRFMSTEPFQPGSFKLQSTSPAIQKGVTLPSFSVDYFGRTRSGVWDIGASEDSGQ